MKKILFLSLITLTTYAQAASDWKVIAETTNCDEKIQIMGKEGEKFVKAVNNGRETKLFPKDKSLFHEENMKMTEFESAKDADEKYTFIQPSYVEPNPPKIDVSMNGTKTRCKMNLAH